MTLEEFTEMYEAAARLERAGDYVTASEAFLVVGDAAEEIGNTDYARDARRRAMLNHVAGWARRRWPAEELHVHDVTFSQFPFGTFGRRRSRVDIQIRRRYQYPVTVAHVTVGRRGDVRLEHEGRLARRARPARDRSQEWVSWTRRDEAWMTNEVELSFGTLSAEYDFFHDHYDDCVQCTRKEQRKEQPCAEGAKLLEHVVAVAKQDYPPTSG